MPVAEEELNAAARRKRLIKRVALAGVSVGGMTPSAAQQLLERRAKALEDVPVVFFSGDQRWRITPHRLGVEADVLPGGHLIALAQPGRLAGYLVDRG